MFLADDPCSAETSRKSEALNYPEPLGPPRPVAGDLYLYFTVLIAGYRENGRILITLVIFLTFVPCILVPPKSFIYQLMHNRVALKEY